MQRAAERDQRSQRAKGRGRVLVCAAAVPVVLLVAGCSSDSGSGDKSAGKDSSSGDTASSASASPTVQAAAYAKLPDACGALSKKTLTSLVPKGVKSGKKGTSDDAATRASCSWSSLDNNGVKGSQFRWLNVSLLRFESDAARGEGDQLAHAYFTKQVKDAQAVQGAKNIHWQTVAGTGDEATLVHYDLKKKEGSFKQQTVVARVENVVVTVDYNGAGLAGEKTPDPKTLAKLAEQATKEAVSTVSLANGDGGTGTGSGSGTGSGKASPSPSKSASKAPAPSASPSKAANSASASPSSSAAKKS